MTILGLNQPQNRKAFSHRFLEVYGIGIYTHRRRKILKCNNDNSLVGHQMHVAYLSRVFIVQTGSPAPQSRRREPAN